MDEHIKFEHIIESGSVEQVRQFLLESFHKIKHTTSFNLLINRLERLKTENDKQKEGIALLKDASSELRKFWHDYNYCYELSKKIDAHIVNLINQNSAKK
jgi:hypothetical protein